MSESQTAKDPQRRRAHFWAHFLRTRPDLGAPWAHFRETSLGTPTDAGRRRARDTAVPPEAGRMHPTAPQATRQGDTEP